MLLLGFAWFKPKTHIPFPRLPFVSVSWALPTGDQTLGSWECAEVGMAFSLLAESCVMHTFATCVLPIPSKSPFPRASSVLLSAKAP